ncbi:hypothetical protein MLD52_19895 [Puniceicoccaceae bacterium K14]|nr:hypothetical protein [Puniceicoccaceae bacterium K14]
MKKLTLIVFCLFFFSAQILGLDDEADDYPRDIDIGDSSYVGYSLAMGAADRTVTDLLVSNTVGGIQLAVKRKLSRNGGWHSRLYRLKYTTYEDPQDFDGNGTMKVFKMYTLRGTMSMGVRWPHSGTDSGWVIETWEGEEMDLNFDRFDHVVRSDGSLEVTVATRSGRKVVFESTGVFNWISSQGGNAFRVIRVEDQFGRGLDYFYNGSAAHPYRISDEAGNYLDYQYVNGTSGIARIDRVDASDGQYVIYHYTTSGFISKVEYSDGTEAVYSKTTSNDSEVFSYRDVRANGYLSDVKITQSHDTIVAGRDTVSKVSSLETGYLLSERTVAGSSTDTSNLVTETRGDGAQRSVRVQRWFNKRIGMVTDFKGNQTSYGYNDRGAVRTVIDANGNRTEYSREDVFNLITKKTYPDNSFEEWTYEEIGSRLYLETYKNQRGYVTDYTRN